MIVFPLAFVSSAYVPVATMPGWLQPFAQHQPVTSMVDAVRGLTLGPGPGRARPPGLLLRRAVAPLGGRHLRRLRPAGRRALPARLTKPKGAPP